MKKAAPALSAVALTVLLACTAGCGSTASSTSAPKLSGSDQKISDGIASYVAKGSSGLITKKDAQCFSDKFVAKAGVSQLKKAKLIKSDGTVNDSGATFDEPLATTYADAYFSCLDYAGLEATYVAKSDPTVDAGKLKTCISGKVEEADSKKLVISSLLGKTDKALSDKNTAAITACQKSSKKVTK